LSSDDIKQSFVFEIDQASINKTLSAVDSLESSLLDLDATASRMGSGALEMGSDYERSLLSIENQARETRDALEDIKPPRPGQPGKGGAGGAGAGLGQIGRLEGFSSSAIGLTGSTALRPLGEAAGLVDQFAASIETMNPAVKIGAGLIAGVAVAFAILNEQSKAAVAEYSAQAAAQREFATAVAGGLTTEDAAEKIKTWNAELERQIPLLEKRAEEQEKYDGILFKALDFTGLSAPIEAVGHAYDAQKSTVEELRANIELYSQGLEDNAFATNDATAAAEDMAEAEKKLAEERSQAVVDAAAQAADLVRFRAEAKELTKQDIEDRLAGFEIERKALKVQLSALKASGDVSETVAKQIQEVEEALGLLGSQTKILKEASKTAKDEEEKEVKTKEKSKHAEKSLGSAREATAKQTESAQQKLADLQKDFFEKGQDAERQYRRDLAAIGRKAKQDEKGELLQRDFERVAAIRDSAAFEADELAIKEREAGEDRLLELQRSQADIAQEQQRALRSRLTAERQYSSQSLGIQQQTHNNSLKLFQAWGASFNQIMSDAISGSRRRSGSSGGVSADDLITALGN
jgi:hypothetical protein